MQVSPAPFIKVGSHTSNSTLSSAATVTTPATSTGIIAQALTQNIRYTIDGTTPTASLGFQLKAGDQPVFIPVFEGTAVKFIEETATANLQYQAVRTADTRG